MEAIGFRADLARFFIRMANRCSPVALAHFVLSAGPELAKKFELVSKEKPE